MPTDDAKATSPDDAREIAEADAPSPEPDDERPVEADDNRILLPDTDADGDPGLPPVGEDPMDGAAPSG